MIYLNKGTAKLITDIATSSIKVASLTDNEIISNVDAIKDIKTNLTKEHLKVIRTLGQLFVVNNAEKLRRGIKESLDGQMNLFDYEEETKLLK